jgi:SPP1 gp7 family putative phage head morphogenesis protein
MNLNPLKLLTARRAKASPGSAILASTVEVEALGPFQAALGGFVPRKVNPWLYEAIREAVPLIDGAIGTLVTMDGIVRVEGDNEALVAEIRDWLESVTVGDLQKGLQAAYASQSNEAYEQGFGVVEWLPSADGRDIASLRVADSKGVVFVRTESGLQAWYRAPATLTGKGGQVRDGSDTVEALLRGTAGLQVQTLVDFGYVQLDLSRVLYMVNEPEADNPYGTSKIRSLEFPSQVLVKIVNAVARAWERYGDPPLHLNYKTKNPKVDETKLAARQKVLAESLAKALEPKARGNSADLVTTTGALDEIGINTIGAQGVALDAEKPMAQLSNQVIAKFGLPGWVLGLDIGGGAGQDERQSEMVLQAARTRWELRKPGLTHLVATLLRMRGRTWKPGDWELKQELPSLADMMKQAQANFLNAQAAMVARGNSTDGTTPSPRGIDNNLRASSGQRAKGGGAKAASDDEPPGEPWAEPDPHLPRIERAETRGALTRWWELAREALAAIGFHVAGRAVTPDDPTADTFTFDHGRYADLLALGEHFTRENSGEDAPVLQATWEAWVRGFNNASDELSADTAITAFEDRVRTELLARGGDLVRSAVGRAYRTRVVDALVSGAYDGMNPVTVAASLQQQFRVGEYDWERLIRSEMAIAQSRGKRELYRANGYALYDYTTAGDDRVSQICQDLSDAGPYPVDSDSSPIPVVDSHPNCRCSITPHPE